MADKKIDNKKITPLFIGIIVIFVLIVGSFFLFFNKKEKPQTIDPIVKSADAKILADGMIRSQNEVNLHFATGGKLVYLPFKEGDQVQNGQIIASLDTYALQKQLTATLNNYRITRDSFDQLQDNIQNNVGKAQITNPYDFVSKAGIGGANRDHTLDDMIKRLADESQAGLDNSVIQVELTNYAFTLSSLTAPFRGVITHLDVTTSNIMVSPATSFIMADPDALVFRANVSENNINFISIGGKASIQLTGMKDKTFDGIVTKIYPDKITLPSGQNVYQVDIESTDLKSVGKFEQDGAVLINSKYDHQVMLVPTWLVLSKQYIWVEENNQPVLRQVTVGNTVGNYVEITGGLPLGDKLIINPSSVVGNKYIIL